MSKIANQRLAQSISTATIFEKITESTLKTSIIAAWFAPPPIQLPAIVVIPYANNDKSISTIEGKKYFTTKIEIGPPNNIPRVPEKNIINALEPSLEISLKSTLRVNKTKEHGSKYLDAT